MLDKIMKNGIQVKLLQNKNCQIMHVILIVQNTPSNTKPNWTF